MRISQEAATCGSHSAQDRQERACPWLSPSQRRDVSSGTERWHQAEAAESHRLWIQSNYIFKHVQSYF